MRVDGRAQAEPVNPVLRQFTPLTAMTAELETLWQSLPLDGNIIVSTPQSLVQMVVEKAHKMAGMLNVPILGVVENMSHVVCPDCGKKISVFGDDTQLTEAVEKMGSKVLARLPIDTKVAALCDSGEIERVLCEDLDPAADAVEALLK